MKKKEHRILEMITKRSRPIRIWSAHFGIGISLVFFFCFCFVTSMDDKFECLFNVQWFDYLLTNEHMFLSSFAILRILVMFYRHQKCLILFDFHNIGISSLSRSMNAIVTIHNHYFLFFFFGKQQKQQVLLTRPFYLEPWQLMPCAV